MPDCLRPLALVALLASLSAPGLGALGALRMRVPCQQLGALRTRVRSRVAASERPMSPNLNVLGTELQCCCDNVRGTGIGTGFYRNGLCATGPDDGGRHTVCVEASAEFLAFSKQVGNDLSQPLPEYLFPGVNPGDRWCLCAARWKQALDAGRAPRIFLQSTHEKTLQFATLEQLKSFALDLDEAEAAVAQLDTLRAQMERALKSKPGELPE
ncbi:hypothetical protein T492DRAFT_1090983 [Pavlovales sp. CCMP2436]|nr:hypothetical protein T492DRAFT_1090983 [Pavlovales sp. CCMP2436]